MNISEDAFDVAASGAELNAEERHILFLILGPWMAVFLLLLALIAVYLNYNHSRGRITDSRKDDLFLAGFLATGLWPLLLVGGAVAAPIWLAGHTGKRIGARHEACAIKRVEELRALRDVFAEDEPEWDTLNEAMNAAS